MLPTTAKGYPAQVAVIRFADSVSAPAGTSEPDLYRVGSDLIYRDTAGVEHIVGSVSGLTGILGLANGGTGADLSAATVNSLLVKLTNKVATGASAVAFAVDNLIDLVTGGARLFSFRSAGTEKAAILGSGGLLAPTAGPSATQQHTLPSVASGTILASGASAVTDDTLVLGDGTHRLTSLGVKALLNGASSLLVSSAQPDGVSSWQVRLQQTLAMVTGGSCMLRLETAAQQAQSGVGSLQLGCPSLGQADAMCYAEWVTSSGTVTAGETVVHSGAKLVATAAASAGLTTIAGVALTTGTNAPVLIAKRGRVYTNADAGSTVGQLLKTSGAVAGNVVNGGTAVGSIVGRACESSAATVAGKILVDLTLS